MANPIDMTEIVAFVGFRSELAAGLVARGRLNSSAGPDVEERRLIPTDSDLLLSDLEPFRDSQIARVRVYDLGTGGGRLRGIINGISETPAVIVDGERYSGLVQARAILRELCQEARRQRQAAETARHQEGER